MMNKMSFNLADSLTYLAKIILVLLLSYTVYNQLNNELQCSNSHSIANILIYMCLVSGIISVSNTVINTVAMLFNKKSIKAPPQ